MQSFTTQSHQRNYQGNVVLPETNRTAVSRPKHNKFFGIIAASMMTLAIITTGSFLGATTLHNQQLKHQVRALETQIAAVDATQPNEEMHRNDEQQPTPEHGKHPHHHHKNLRRIPISEKHHETQPLPSVNQNRHHSETENFSIRLD